MANPSKPKIIKITLSTGAAGQPIIVRNRTTADVLNITVGAANKAQVDLQNFTNGYTSGDVIEFIVSGEKLGTTLLTTSGDDPESVTLSTSSITSGIARGI